jgi:hypothetical protein
VDAVVDAELEVVHHHVGVGEVHDGTRAGLHQGREVVARVDPRHELGVVGRVDGAADLGTDLAQRAQHAHLENLIHGSQPSVSPECGCGRLDPCACSRSRPVSGGRST